MRKFLNVKIKKESFDSLSHHFLQKKTGEHLGNIYLGTPWKRFQVVILTVKMVFNQRHERITLFIRPPNLLTNIYKTWRIVCDRIGFQAE